MFVCTLWFTVHLNPSPFVETFFFIVTAKYQYMCGTRTLLLSSLKTLSSVQSLYSLLSHHRHAYSACYTKNQNSTSMERNEQTSHLICVVRFVSNTRTSCYRVCIYLIWTTFEFWRKNTCWNRIFRPCTNVKIQNFLGLRPWRHSHSKTIQQKWPDKLKILISTPVLPHFC